MNSAWSDDDNLNKEPKPVTCCMAFLFKTARTVNCADELLNNCYLTLMRSKENTITKEIILWKSFVFMLFYGNDISAVFIFLIPQTGITLILVPYNFNLPGAYLDRQ